VGGDDRNMFGTSGVRGPVGEEVTADLALDVGRALATDGTDTTADGPSSEGTGSSRGPPTTVPNVGLVEQFVANVYPPDRVPRDERRGGERSISRETSRRVNLAKGVTAEWSNDLLCSHQVNPS
jgi:hypothetical protein